MVLTLQRGASLILGFGLSLLPAFAPFLALLYFLTERWRFSRLDGLVALAAVLFAVPLAITSGIQTALLGMFQIIAAWLLFRSFSKLAYMRSKLLHGDLVGLGLIAGLTLVVALGFLRIENVHFLARVWQAVVWEDSPALYAHTALVLGALIALIAPTQRYRLVSLGLAALAILVAGSREAAIAWVIITLGLLIISPARSIRRRITEWIVLAVMMIVTAGLGALWGWGNFGFLLDLAPSSETRNLLQGTEVGNGDWWFEQGVVYSTGSSAIDGTLFTRYTIQKNAPENWRRLQQFVPIDPGTSYTASALIKRRSVDSLPGLQGWGELIGGETLSVTGALHGTEWRTAIDGPGALLGAGTEEYPNGWRRVWVSFEYHGTDTLYWWIGLAPDQRNELGSATDFAAFQFEQGNGPSAYEAGSARAGLGLRTARVPYWQAAVAGIAEKPILGWGASQFDDFFRDVWRNRSRFEVVPQHTHNLVLQVLFERGLVGALGLVLFLTALLVHAFRRRDAPLLLVAGGLLVSNMFDFTLMYGGVIYPFAAAAGWRSTTNRNIGRVGDESGQQMLVRAALAATDFATAVASLILATVVLGGGGRFGADHDIQLLSLPYTLFYAFLLWPLATWREGLYPGYGLAPAQELGKHVKAGLFAGLLLAGGSLFLPFGTALPRSTLLLTVLLALFLTPIGRGLIKRGLLRLGIWGRPVAVLGAGATGQRVVRALRRAQLDGLQPVALFDDDPELFGHTIDGVVVRGPLQAAAAFGRENGVDHAIVAIPSLPASTTSLLIDRQGRVFRHMQFIPQLSGLPAEEVYATSLDGMLALQVRNGLYSRRNRTFKRAIDLLGTALGAVLALPLIAAVHVWVRLDSRGPGFYRSERIGENGEHFSCLKFRTMYIDADERLAEIMASDEAIRSEYLHFHKLEQDPRVTRVGRFLRRFSLDELPQLINVLRGEMSLVGPRPYMVRERGDMGDYAETILRAKPGITGYWQVSGRSKLSFQERLEMEAHYVRNWSIWWDIIVLVNTAGAVLRRDGAS